MGKSRIDSILKDLICKPKLTSTIAKSHRRTLGNTAGNPMIKPFLCKALGTLLKIARTILSGFYGVICTFLHVLLKEFLNLLRNDSIDVMNMIIRLKVDGFPTDFIPKHRREML